MAERAAGDRVGDISIHEAEATDVPLLAELNLQLIRDKRHRNPMFSDYCLTLECERDETRSLPRAAGPALQQG